MKDVAQPNTRRRRLGIILTIVGVICTIGFSIFWGINVSLPTQVLAIISTLILALGLTLLRPLRFIEGER